MFFRLVMKFFATIVLIAGVLFLGIDFNEFDWESKLRFKPAIQIGGNIGIGYFLWYLIFVGSNNQTIDGGLLLAYQNPEVKALYQAELAEYFSNSPFVSLYQTVISVTNYVNVWLLSHINPAWKSVWMWAFGTELSSAGATIITLIVCIGCIAPIVYFITMLLDDFFPVISFILKIIIGLSNAVLFQTIAYFTHYEEILKGHEFTGHIYFALVFTIIVYIIQVGLYFGCITDIISDKVYRIRKQKNKL
ncbi:MAG: hypothetical protein K6E64_09830 [Lachnospiraceae bacterium]|nr:hypothetical protein [Lachnospiraceae bacterium]